MKKFNETDIATIKEFVRRAADFLGSDEGIVGFDDEGVIVNEWDTEEDYGGGSYLTSSTSFISWVAFTDPAEHERQVAAEEAERNARYEQQLQETAQARLAEERAAYERLKAKFGPPA